MINPQTKYTIIYGKMHRVQSEKYFTTVFDSSLFSIRRYTTKRNGYWVESQQAISTNAFLSKTNICTVFVTPISIS